MLAFASPWELTHDLASWAVRTRSRGDTSDSVWHVFWIGCLVLSWSVRCARLWLAIVCGDYTRVGHASWSWAFRVPHTHENSGGI